MNPSPSLGFIPIARPTFDVPLAQEKTANIRQQLSANRFDFAGPVDLVMDAAAVKAAIDQLKQDAPDLVLIFQASFADSTMALEIASQIDAPLVLWAVPEERAGGRLRLNSFCGINLAGHGLTRAGYSYDYIYAEPDDPAALQKLAAISKAAMARRRLKNARVGRVGENPVGFDTCLVDVVGLRKTFGVEIVQMQLADVFAGVRTAEPAAVKAVSEQIRGQLAGIDELDTKATNGTLGTYITLRDVAAKQSLDGYAVRCWPEFFSELGCSACGAMSMLSNEQKPCSCEADINGTITQLILQWLSGEAAFGSDLVSFDVDKDIAILWHCGLAPLSMADPDFQPQATIHSNRKMPLLMQFPLKPGRVTLARISEATGSFRLVIGSGEMVKAPPAFTGTSGTLRFDSGAQQVMDTIMREGLEHHLSLTYGDHVDSLLSLARMLDLPVLRL